MLNAIEFRSNRPNLDTEVTPASESAGLGSQVDSVNGFASKSAELSMLPVTSGNYRSGQDKSVLATAIKQLKRRFGRKLRRSLQKQRFLLLGLGVVLLIVWWLSRAVRPVSDVVVVRDGLFVHAREDFVVDCISDRCQSDNGVSQWCVAA